MKPVEKHNPEVTTAFFFCFARFEYALKACGYLNQQGDVLPDWGKFAKYVKPVFENPKSVELGKAIQYYLFHYVFKMALIQGQLVSCRIANLFAAISAKPDSA